jgi:hypothetical protein
MDARGVRSKEAEVQVYRRKPGVRTRGRGVRGKSKVRVDFHHG